jgi:hypothetical protein
MWPNAFQPINSNTATGIEYVAPLVVAASVVSSAASTLPGNSSGDGSNPDIRIENQTNGWAMCNFGDGNQGAATLTNGVGVPPNTALVIRVAPTTNSVTVILFTGATAGNVRFLRGSGID